MKKQQIGKLLLVSIASVFYISTAFAKSPVGHWTTVDDRTGKKRSEVYLSLNHNELSGKILRVYAEKGDTRMCKSCPGEFRNKPIKNLVFIWGLKENKDGSWSGGEILDPKSGKIYRARMIQKGKKLYVRGYVGLPILGRTQIWTRV
ncbi:MAG: DUF2147 domain-containing protein [Gammaproteobacteria bacterium]|nr:DUF2147 domain-containing protein [Gammaproteobacteria bacterium]MCH9715818.1 DUF2147 domain-containing protein [Gammaproteobacteria bacterium]MCH9763498.1 DUF2147 domain-containing protein [Gammaproteobacteria bacterium]